MSGAAPVADLERRFYALAVDRAIAWSAYALAVLAAWWLFFRGGNVWPGVAMVVFVVLVVNLLFAVLLGSQGISPGKAAAGLRVVDPLDGTPIGLGRAVLRIVIVGAGSLPMFGLGLATLAWTAVEDRTGERRGWHDHVARSIVVDIRPGPVAEAEVDDRPRHVVNLTAMKLMPVKQAPPPPAVPEPAVRSTTRVKNPPPVQALLVPAPPAPVQPSWRVSFDSGESLVVEGLGLVGRNPQAKPGEPVRHAVPLLSAKMSISKTHAQFHIASDGALVVVDRGSTNGSILIRQGVSRELSAGKPATLLDGDRVVFGDREMRVSRENS